MLKTDNVSKLREAIKAKGAIRLQNIGAQDIDLWSVSFPTEDLTSKAPQLEGPSLRPNKKLSEVFPLQLDPGLIHVVARGLVKGQCCIASGIILFNITPFRRSLT